MDFNGVHADSIVSEEFILVSGSFYFFVVSPLLGHSFSVTTRSLACACGFQKLC